MPLAPITDFDSFTRTRTDGLGSADTGSAWKNLNGNASSESRFSMDASNGYARLTAGSAFSYGAQYLETESTSLTGTVLVRMRLSAADTNLFAGVSLRHNNSRFIGARLGALSIDGSSLLSIVYIDSTGKLQQENSVARYDIDPNVWFWLKLTISGTTISAKAWPAGTAEPAAMQLTAQTASWMTTSAGYPGVFYGLAAYTANRTVDYQTLYYYGASPTYPSGIIRDDFSRNVIPGLGISDSGHIWEGTFADDPFAYASYGQGSKTKTSTLSTGTITAIANAIRYGWIGNDDKTTHFGTMKIQMQAGAQFGIGVRGGFSFSNGLPVSNKGYVFRSGVGGCQIVRLTDDTTIATRTFDNSFNDGQYVYLRVAAQGTTISGKVWSASSPEPAGWTLSVTDSTTTTGGAFIYSRGTTSSNVSTTIDGPILFTTAIENGVGDLDATSDPNKKMGSGGYQIWKPYTIGTTTFRSFLLTDAAGVVSVTAQKSARYSNIAVTSTSSVFGTFDKIQKVFALPLSDPAVATSSLMEATVRIRLSGLEVMSVSSTSGLDETSVYILPPNAVEWFDANRQRTDAVIAKAAFSAGTFTVTTNQVAVAGVSEVDVPTRSRLQNEENTVTSESAVALSELQVRTERVQIQPEIIVNIDRAQNMAIANYIVPANSLQLDISDGDLDESTTDAFGRPRIFVYRGVNAQMVEFSSETTMSSPEITIVSNRFVVMSATGRLLPQADSEAVLAKELEIKYFSPNTIIRSEVMTSNFQIIGDVIGTNTDVDLLALNSFRLGMAGNARFSAFTDLSNIDVPQRYMHVGYAVMEIPTAIGATLTPVEKGDQAMAFMRMSGEGFEYFWTKKANTSLANLWRHRQLAVREDRLFIDPELKMYEQGARTSRGETKPDDGDRDNNNGSNGRPLFKPNTFVRTKVDDVQVRNQAGFDGKVIDTLPEDKVVKILDGPVWENGKPWYYHEFATGFLGSKGWSNGKLFEEVRSETRGGDVSTAAVPPGESPPVGGGDTISTTTTPRPTSTTTPRPSATTTAPPIELNYTSRTYQCTSSGPTYCSWVCKQYVNGKLVRVYSCPDGIENDDNSDNAPDDDTTHTYPTPTGEVFKKGSVVKTTGYGLRVRSGPGTNYPILDTLPAGKLLTILDGPVWANDNPWYEHRYESSGKTKKGWSSGLYMTLVSPPPATTRPPSTTLPPDDDEEDQPEVVLSDPVTRMMYVPFEKEVLVFDKTSFKDSKGFRVNLSDRFNNAKAVNLAVEVNFGSRHAAPISIHGVQKHELTGMFTSANRYEKSIYYGTVYIESVPSMLVKSNNRIDSIKVYIIGMWV